MTPPIDCLGKTRPGLKVSIHIYGVFEEIDGKTFILRVKHRHVTPQIDHLRKTSPVLRVSTHIYGVFEEIDGKSFIFESKRRHVTPQIDCLEKNEPCSEGFNPHLWCFQGQRWKNIHF